MDPDATQRIFVAAYVDATDALRAVLDALRDLRGINAVAASQLHVTMRFLGEVTMEQRDRFIAFLREAGAGKQTLPPFDMKLGGIGTFPARGAPRVIWIGVDEPAAAALRVLADRADAAAERTGLPSRDKPFAAHVTIARCERPDGRARQQVTDLVARNETTSFGTMHVDRLAVVRRTLTTHGPHYETVAEVAL